MLGRDCPFLDVVNHHGHDEFEPSVLIATSF
jgi:hypothetical protein